MGRSQAVIRGEHAVAQSLTPGFEFLPLHARSDVGGKAIAVDAEKRRHVGIISLRLFLALAA